VILGLLLLGGRHLCDVIGAISRLGRCVVKALRLRSARTGLDTTVTSPVVHTAAAQRQGEDPEQQHRSDDDQHSCILGPVLSSVFG
jgi:hypothetical protein